MMTNRQRFFNILEGKPADRAPYFPDISLWYEYTRKGFGEEQLFGPGVYIPDGLEFHKRESRLTGKHANFTFLDYYREYDWGLPVHIYDWSEAFYTGGIERTCERRGKYDVQTFKTPKGDLRRRYILDSDGSWAPCNYWMDDFERQLEALKYLIAHTEFKTDFSSTERFLRETDGFGVCDIVIARSPFGKIVHEYLGFEHTVYALADHEKEIDGLLKLQEELDLRLVELAARAPARIVIISDHADENLIAPPYYQKYCIPFYQKARSILKTKNKYVSTHLDGNIKGYLPFIAGAGFDLLDGCTPAPMFNYEPEALSAAIKGGVRAYCGVPASMILENADSAPAIEFAGRIVKAFGGEVIVNIGDVTPVNGSLQAVIGIGMALQGETQCYT
ncbi:MAG: hypothetical protein FWE62_01340 [Firmicutes bacterium]|nr:hypothetical protein [Bacillota bacterium]